MDPNNTSSSDSGGGNINNDPTLRLTIVALVISLVALGLSTLQAFLAYLQFDISELGGKRSSEEIMGKGWAKLTRRTFHWRRLRYQVYFEVPVFYTAPPGITVGPISLQRSNKEAESHIRGSRLQGSGVEPSSVKTFEPEVIGSEIVALRDDYAPIYKITGTDTSYMHTLLSPPQSDGRMTVSGDGVCSWLILLMEMQNQERMSREWDRGPQNRALDHTVCYLFQRRRHCWDYLPPDVTKPFATTTICHLVEIMSMLGLVWTEFDVKGSNLTAEGNGCMVTSEHVKGLGILVKFFRLSRPVHRENRVIPSKDLKRLCFGDVPSLFDTIGQKLSVGPLQLESSLSQLLPGIAHEHRQVFLGADTRFSPSPLSPTFELIAMVANSFHIRGSKFRRIPNPCKDTPPQDLSAINLLHAFATELRLDADLGTAHLTQELKNAFERGRCEERFCDPSGDRTLMQLITDYSNVKTQYEKSFYDRYYDPSLMPDDGKAQEEQTKLRLLDALHTTHEAIGERVALSAQGLFKAVISSHFNAVLDHQHEFRELMAQTSAKEETLVKFYFYTVRPAVIKLSSKLPTNNSPSESPSSSQEDEVSAVWLALIFRAWSWLLLHDFDPLDQMIERTKYQNSRLQVYIT